VNKSELVEHISDQSGLSKAGAARAVEVILNAITRSLKKGEPVSIVGFGTFAVKKRLPRTRRNPKTGVTVAIDTTKVPVFKSSNVLKETLN
jgi:DNA-binding protein HU-beta